MHVGQAPTPTGLRHVVGAGLAPHTLQSQLSQPPQFGPPGFGAGAMTRPSDFIQAGVGSRNNGSATAMRSRRVAFGNC